MREDGIRADGAWSWIPFVAEQMEHHTLHHIDDEEIKRMLHEGMLPCGWTHNPAWKKIVSLTEGYLKEQVSLEQEEKRLTEQLKCTQSQLARVHEKKQRVTQLMQQQTHARMTPSAVHLDELTAFVQRVEPIEMALVTVGLPLANGSV